LPKDVLHQMEAIARRMDADFNAIEEVQKLVMVEFLNHYEELKLQMPDAARHAVFEAWTLQKLGAMQYVITQQEELINVLTAYHAKLAQVKKILKKRS